MLCRFILKDRLSTELRYVLLMGRQSPIVSYSSRLKLVVSEHLTFNQAYKAEAGNIQAPRKQPEWLADFQRVRHFRMN